MGALDFLKQAYPRSPPRVTAAYRPNAVILFSSLPGS